MKLKIKKYSKLIRPLIILFDIIIINSFIIISSDSEYINFHIIIYIILFWLIISYYTKFYSVYRYTHVLKLVTKLLSHFFVFILAFFAYYTIFREGEVISKQSNIVISILITVAFFKFLFYFVLKSYRSKGNNYRNVVVFGDSKSAQNVIEIFNDRQDLGYRFNGFFSDKISKSKKYLGTITEGLNYTNKENIDEVYCDINSISTLKYKEIRDFCRDIDTELKLIPENKAIYSKNFKVEYYGTLPILRPKQLPFERIETHIIKRIFDIIFSLFVCLFILSWLFPILWVIVKINSKGKFFFKQKRDGINGKQFYCYKIRSMKNTDLADKISTTNDDNRITFVGAFLRKTSLDELPQFFNVLLGDMSVVGPRPHINVQTKNYINEIDNYLIRNSIKPGITGLAQVSGYRGEIIYKSEIENRVRLDIFYIENWSFILDIKIIFQTFLIVFKGQEKAY